MSWNTRALVLAVLMGMALSSAAQAQNDLVAPAEGPVAVDLSEPVPLPRSGEWDLLHDNGPLVNSLGTGVGGADESVLQNVSLGMSAVGFDNSVGSGWRVADDFNPGGTDMHVLTYVVYAYQTGAGRDNPTMDELNLCVWRGEPGNGGVPYWGSCASNELAFVTEEDVFRVTEQTAGSDTSRAIYSVAADYSWYMKHYVGDDTFWLDWQVGGTLDSGPFTPPVTVTDSCATGNGIQSFDGGQTWVPAIDPATGCQQGFPFQLWGYFWIPVELTSFEVVTDGSDVMLHWATASETNNAGFEVQRLQGDDWTALGFVEGHGTTTEARTYSYTAAGMAVGAHTFRLKQIDYDGTFEYSPEVEATIKVVGTHALSAAYPNPFNPQAQFTLAVARDQRVAVDLYNTLGQRVATLFEGTVEANASEVLTIDGAGLASGLYVVQVSGETFTDALRVTLLK